MMPARDAVRRPRHRVLAGQYRRRDDGALNVDVDVTCSFVAALDGVGVSARRVDGPVHDVDVDIAGSFVVGMDAVGLGAAFVRDRPDDGSARN